MLDRAATPARIGVKAGVDGLSKAVTLVVTMAAARALEPEAFGMLALGMTSGWILGVVTDAGLSMHLARAVARAPHEARGLAFRLISVRALAAALALVLTAVLSTWFVPDPWPAAFVLLVAAQLAGAVLDTVAHAFRGLERIELESAIQLAQRAAAVGLALAVLGVAPQLDLLAAALVVPPATAAVIAA
ncbi:MAG: oligosaccharide flippase family protein, partial [Acidobacteriota bacterium]